MQALPQHRRRPMAGRRATRRGSPASTPGGTSAFQSMALGDLDGDGDTDVVDPRPTTATLRVWRNDGGNRQHVAARAARRRASATAAASARRSSCAPAACARSSRRRRRRRPSRRPIVVFGLGTRTAADVVRVLWPSGILQAETTCPRRPRRRAQPITVTELDRKPSSCPYLFTWNGTRFEFVTDFMGGGEMGGWAGPAAVEPARSRRVRAHPRRSAAAARRPLRAARSPTSSRKRCSSIACSSSRSIIPADVDVYPERRVCSQPPRAPFALLRRAGRAAAGCARSTSTATTCCRRSPRSIAAIRTTSRLLPIRGYAAPHALDARSRPGVRRAPCCC